MIIAGTGHRPEDFLHSETEVRTLARNKFRAASPDVFISGMAAGFDLLAADEARLLGIEVWAARPWAGHEARVEDKDLYEKIMEYANKTVDVAEEKDYPGPWCYHKRNEWMVDHATHVLAYLNPDKTSGGTFACVRYAKKVGKPVANLIKDPPF